MKKIYKISIIFFIIICIVFLTNFVQAITIVLDPGHGGTDPGAVNGTVYEKDVTLKIAKYMKEYLSKYNGVNILLTHNGIANKELMVFGRAIFARENKADLLISLHINSSTDEKAKGAEIYVSANKSLDKYNKNTTEVSNKILENLSKIGISNNGVKTKLIPTDTTDIYTDGTRADYYGIIRYAMRGTMIDSGKVTVIKDGKKVEVLQTESANVQKGEGIPTILIEHCFIRGNDFQYIDSDEDIKKIAKADVDAIVEYYNLKLKETPEKKIVVDNKNLTIKLSPDATIENLEKELNTTKYSIIDKDGKTISDKKLATGYKIKIEDKSYSLIKAGDVNGDSEVDVIDLALMKRHLMETQKLKDNYYKAGMLQKDGTEIDVIDLALLKRVLMGTTQITF